MSIYSLAISARATLTVMLVVIILLTLLFGAMLFMILKNSKKSKTETPGVDVMHMLERHDAHLSAEIEKVKGDDAKKEALSLKQRRIQAAKHLIDEMIKEDEARAAAIAAKRKEQAAAARQNAAQPKPEAHANAENKPAENAGGNADSAEKKD